MARYDRIARLDPPSRAQAFPGWLVLRDLDGNDRDGELGRRARLRFLALRPVRRLLEAGFDGVATPSLERHLDHVRQELDQLGTRDAERIRIIGYLREIGTRAPRRATVATVGMGEAAEGAGHGYAAEEYYLTGLALAEAHRLTDQRARSLRCLGRLYGGRGEWDRARECLEACAALTLANDPAAWGSALAELAIQRIRSGDTAGAQDVAATVAARATEDDRLEPIAAAIECAIALMQGKTEAGIEAGWRAIDLLPAADEDRNRVLFDLGTAFRGLGLRAAAEACYAIISDSSPASDAAIEAQIEHALTAAEAGDLAAFESRRTTLLAAVHEHGPEAGAMTHLGLGRGAMTVEQIDDARHHLRDAMSIARSAGLVAVMAEAEDLLSGLERRVDHEIRSTPPTPTANIRSIAERIESLGKTLAPSG